MDQDPNIPTHDKLHAHSLMVDCIKVKEGLISDPTIIQEALDIVDQTKKRIVEISQENSKELLHIGEKEVQPTKQQYQQQEEELEEHQEEEQQEQKTNNSIF